MNSQSPVASDREGPTRQLKPSPAEPASPDLRQAAEARLNAASATRPVRNEAELQAFQHELDLRQMELEIQREELQAAWARYITERKAEQAALRENDARFRAIFDSSAVATAIIEPDSTISMVNDVYCQIGGYTREDVVGKSWRQTVVPEDFERITEYHRRRLLNPQDAPAQYEFRYLHKSGAVRHCQIAVALIPSTGQVIASMLDITERKQAAEQMHVQFSALSAAANAIVITSRDGKIEWVNPSFTKLTGYSAALAIGRNPRVLKSGEHPPAFYSNMWETILGGHTWHGEIINRQKDGRLYTEEMTITPVRGADGQIAHFVAIKQDVTERRQLEKRMQQAQKMEAIGTLAGGIAHDFNNILGAMFGYAHLLQQDTVGNLVAQESVEEILKAANRAKELVQQILTFSRQREQKPQIINLQLVVKEAVKFLRASLPAQIEIDLELDAGTPAVLADPTQIYQVTMNLATNALHAMGNQPGRLLVRLEPVLPDAKLLRAQPELKPMLYARLTVADTGHGMDAKTLERIFEPFFTTKPVGKGTGLGLAVVHGIVQSHGGTITVASKVGRGTTFHLYFPAQAQIETLSPAIASAVPRGHGQKILVLDDEKTLTSVLQQMLRRLNYQVTTTNQAREAIRLVRENPAQFDLVITDLTMPEIDGLEVARQFRALRPELLVILVSGYGAVVDADSLSEAGICERLEKPLSFSDLAAVVERVFKKSKAGSRS